MYSSFKMSHANKLWIEAYSFALFEEKYSYCIIQTVCEMQGIKISYNIKKKHYH